MKLLYVAYTPFLPPLHNGNRQAEAADGMPPTNTMPSVSGFSPRRDGWTPGLGRPTALQWSQRAAWNARLNFSMQGKRGKGHYLLPYLEDNASASITVLAREAKKIERVQPHRLKKLFQ